MRNAGVIKIFLIIFIVIAIFNYRNESLNQWAIKTGVFLRGFSANTSVIDNSNASDVKPQVIDDKKADQHVDNEKVVKDDQASLKISPSEDSLMANFFANVINKVLSTPNGQVLLKEAINNASARRDRFSQDLEEKQYLATDLKIGNGRSVSCGDEVEITYTIHKKLESPKEKKFFKTKIVIGQRNLAMPLESAIIGMKEGGQKKVAYFVPDQFGAVNAKTKKEEYTQFVAEVALDKISSLPLDQKSPIRIFVNNPSHMGKKIFCGDSVQFSYKISDMNNNYITDNNSSNRVVLGIYKDQNSQLKNIYNSIVNTYRDHVRVTVILKYNQLKQLIPDVNLNKKVPDDQMLVLDLYGFPSASLQDIKIHSLFGGSLNQS